MSSHYEKSMTSFRARTHSSESVPNIANEDIGRNTEYFTSDLEAEEKQTNKTTLRATDLCACDISDIFFKKSF